MAVNKRMAKKKAKAMKAVDAVKVTENKVAEVKPVEESAKPAEVVAEKVAVEVKEEVKEVAAETKVVEPVEVPVKEEVAKVAEEPAKEVVEKKKNTEKKPATKRTVKAKTEESGEKKPAVKKAAKVATKDAAEKKPATKRTTKKVVKANIVVQVSGREISMEDAIERATEDWCKSGNDRADLKEIAVYVKPEEFAIFYVINGRATGKVTF